MKMLTNYFLLEGKRSFYVLKKSIMSLICVLLALGTMVTGMYFLMMQTTLFPKIDVGVVVSEEDTLVEMATSYISAMDSVESVCNFHYVTYEEGESMLSEGRLQVVVVLPATLYDDLNNLENVQATILLPEGESIGTRMFGQLLFSGIGLLHVAEAGVKASYDVSEGQSLKIERYQLGNFLAIRYAAQALDRMDAFEEMVISPTGKMTMLQFYFLGLLLCVCLVYGVNFSYLFEKKQKALQDKLCIEGVGKIHQAMVRLLLMAVYLFVLECLVYVAGCMVSEAMAMYFLYFEWKAIPAMFLLALAMSVHFHLIYTVARDEKQGALLLLVTGILMVLCSGLIVPQAYLPEVAQVIGNFVPLYGWSLAGQEMLFGELSWTILQIPLVWMLVELVIGVYVSWKNA